MSGPPPVNNWISTKLLKLNANDAINNGANGLINNGNVMWRKFTQGEAPSIAVASYRSSELTLISPCTGSSYMDNLTMH